MRRCDGVANGHGRQAGGGGCGGMANGHAAGGHGGCDLRRVDTRHTPCQGREQVSRAKRQVAAYRAEKEKQAGYMPSLLCAPSAHSSPLGLAPTTARNMIQPKPLSVTGACQRRDRIDSPGTGACVGPRSIGPRCSFLW